MGRTRLTEPLRVSVLDVVAKTPGLSRQEIAKAIYGPNGYRELVSDAVLQLVHEDRLRVRGAGKSGSPYKYYLETRQVDGPGIRPSRPDGSTLVR